MEQRRLKSRFTLSDTSVDRIDSKTILSLLVMFVTLVSVFQFLLVSFVQSEARAIGTSTTNPNNPNSTKIVILTFDDNWKSQFTNVKPILDQYGYKATFFIICNYVGRDN